MLICLPFLSHRKHIYSFWNNCYVCKFESVLSWITVQLTVCSPLNVFTTIMREDMNRMCSKNRWIQMNIRGFCLKLSLDLLQQHIQQNNMSSYLPVPKYIHSCVFLFVIHSTFWHYLVFFSVIWMFHTISTIQGYGIHKK